MPKKKEAEQKSSPVLVFVIVILGVLFILGTVWFAVHQDELFPPETEAETEVSADETVLEEDAELTEDGELLYETEELLTEEDGDTELTDTEAPEAAETAGDSDGVSAEETEAESKTAD